MKNLRKILAMCTCAAMLFSMSACGGNKTAASDPAQSDSNASAPSDTPATATGDTITLKFACDDTTSSAYYLALVEFEKEVEEKSGGSIQVDLYGDAQLGNATETIEGMQMGTIECAFTSTAALSAFVKEFGYVDAPFIFRDADHARAVVDGEIGQWIGDLCVQQQGIRVLGWYDTAFRNIYSTKPIRTLEDFKGLKIRTMQSDLHLQTFEALGCLPVSMSSSEVYTALSQGTIDAAENNIAYVKNQSMYDVIDYVILTGHFYAFCTISISEKVYQSMTPEQQEIVTTAAANSVAFERNLMDEQNEEARAFLEEQGVEFIDMDRAVLRDACQSVYDKNTNILDPAVIEKITNM